MERDLLVDRMQKAQAADLAWTGRKALAWAHVNRLNAILGTRLSVELRHIDKGGVRPYVTLDQEALELFSEFVRLSVARGQPCEEMEALDRAIVQADEKHPGTPQHDAGPPPHDRTEHPWLHPRPAPPAPSRTWTPLSTAS